MARSAAELLLATDLGNYWTYRGEPAAPIVNQAAQELGIFAIQEFLIGGQPSVFISLPQDSLAQLGRKIASRPSSNRSRPQASSICCGSLSR